MSIWRFGLAIFSVCTIEQYFVRPFTFVLKPYIEGVNVPIKRYKKWGREL
jgi:hypothetical protein